MSKTLNVVVVAMMLGGFGAYLYADHATSKAKTASTSPSAQLHALSKAAGLSLLSEPSRPCDLPVGKGRNELRLSRIFTAIDLNSSINEVRSAEAAAMKFESEGNGQMAQTATSDAISRWQQVLRLKADFNCLDFQIQRSSY